MSKSLEDFAASENPERKYGKELVGKVAALIERSGLEPEDIGKIEKIRLNDYEGFYKDNEGVAHKVQLEASSVLLSPKWAEGPEWPLVQQAKPTVVKPPKVVSTKKDRRGWKTAVILPDPQIGFRLIDGQLDPFHDEQAMNVALQATAYLNETEGVDQVINLGDFLDLQQQSRFLQEAAFALTTQPAIDRGHLFLAEQRAAAPDSEIVLIEGNHDKRMQNFITTNAIAAFGIKKANVPDSWPVMSLPYLLRCDELGVKYIDAWPAGEYWLNDKLRAIHGNKVRSNGSTTNAMAKDHPNISTIFGHIHRIETDYRTIHDRTGPIRTMSASPGCLCRVDGAVPSANGAVGIDGRPATHWENWQTGFAVVRYKDSGRFHYTPHQILDGETIVDGKLFSAK